APLEETPAEEAPAATPAQPAPGPAAGQAGSQSPAWQEEWDKLAAAAKAEGALSIVTLVGAGLRDAVKTFSDAFPGIEIQQQQFASASQAAPKILQEREAGLYTFDIGRLQTLTGLGTLKPKGVWTPLRPLLFRADVTGDQYWQDGFEAGWLDSGKELTYAFGVKVTGFFTVNTDMVKDGEITSFNDLLSPKWKGKIQLEDPRSGASSAPMTSVRLKLGNEPIRKLYKEQDAAILRDTRLIAENMVRGKYAVSVGLREEILVEFTNQGLGKNLKNLDIPEASYYSANNIFVMNRAPHPNAAKLFVNWLLTRDGQDKWVKASLEANSRRTDVPPLVPDSAPKPGRTYVNVTREDTLGEVEKTRVLLYDILGITN
ncbi:MAG: extracellular solute-binding protein, partial [Chloroflexota bacterium]